jgi:hypothetical protein
MTIKVDNATLTFKDQEGNIAVLRSLSADDVQAIKDVISQSNTNKGAIADLGIRIDNLESMDASNAVTVVPQVLSDSQKKQARENIAAASETILNQHVDSGTAHYSLFAEKAPVSHVTDLEAHKSLFALKANKDSFEAHLSDDTAHSELFERKQDKSDMVNYVTTATEQEVSGVKNLSNGVRAKGIMAYAGAPRVIITANSSSLESDAVNEEPSVTLRASTDATVSGQSGAYVLEAGTTGARHALVGTADGALTMDGKNVVRSVNGVVADANGNVKVSNANTPSDVYLELSQVATGTTLTAPADGFYTVAGSTGYVRLEGTHVAVADHSNSVSSDVACTIPVRSGDTVTLRYSLDTFSYLRFVYAQGAI